MQPDLRNNNGELSKGPTATAEPSRMGETLRHHRSQSPQESLGLTGQSGLFKASLQAGVLFAVGFAVLTVVPYFLERQSVAAKANAPAPEKTEVAPAPTPTPEKTETTPKTTTTPTGPKVAGKDDILSKLGENTTKGGTPKTKDPFKGAGEDDLPGLK